jgi:hypothetical protein
MTNKISEKEINEICMCDFCKKNPLEYVIDGALICMGCYSRGVHSHLFRG